MDLGLQGRVALVTGASSGIGKAVAQSLAAEGATVAIAARRMDRLTEIASTFTRNGGDAAAFAFDQDDPESPRRLVAEVVAKFGRVDVLIANGGGPKPGTYLQTSIEDWDRGYASGLRSMLELVNAVVPGMRERKWGRIVALTSLTVKEPIPTLVLSNALRIALVSALKTLAGEVGADGVTVNAIATGRVLTERLLELYDGDDRALREAALREVPLGRAASPEEFAPMITFLAGAPASYITGQTIAVDGGVIRGLL